MLFAETGNFAGLDEAFDDGDDAYHYQDDRGKFTISVNNVQSDRFPKRFLCPQSEIDGNPNTPSELKTKKIYDHVWWDVD